ncbi:MAG: signal recognition particle protein [Candidatus Jidaibacter sp.]|jgi:signal recognition particle subunit SRP54|nr:signal recognition particle protein [Candidatus Jidaibacter sp.]
MFSNLSQSLGKVFNKLRGRGVLSDEDVAAALREIRIALLEADVSLPVVKEFVNKIKEKAVGANLIKSVTPGQLVVKIVSDELIELLKAEVDEQALNLKATPPVVILMTGLQGSGKTTTSAKLALKIKNQSKKKILLASLDTYRPAAQHQLETLGKQIEVESLEIIDGQKPLEIAKRAMKFAEIGGYDILILDTAGRLHTDTTMMDELKAVKALAKPLEVLLVADSLTGQDAVNIAKEFNEAIGITGIVLTRVDGDARGGAALSMRMVTGQPIKFIGVGEKPSDLEEFYADRIASRILGMGDVVGLVEKAQEVINEEEANKLALKMQKGVFDLNDLYSQLKNIGRMGGVSKLMGMVPGMGKMKDKLNDGGFGEKKIKQQMAIIESMTKIERKRPMLINASSKKRIASGSGNKVEDVNRLLKQYQTMLKVMKQFGKMSPSDMERMQRMMNVRQ